MEFIEQKAVKLLALAAKQTTSAVAEALCLHPDKRLIRSLLAEVRSTLDEFEEIYFEDENKAS
jgi:hypothetical protein